MNSKLLFFVMTAFLIAACSKDKDTTQDLLQGKWTATSIIEDGNEYVVNNPAVEVTSATLEFKGDIAFFVFSAKYPNFPIEEETYQGNFNSDGKKIEMVLANADSDTIKWDLNVSVLESKKLEVAGTTESLPDPDEFYPFSAKFVR